MARYKPYSYTQGKFIPIHFANQILPGTFEYTLNYLIDHEFDLSIFNGRFKNDKSGAPAYDPKILLKVILYAYSRGIISSRKIERACRENIIFMALSADSRPHFTTIADFISSMDKEIVALFLEVLLVCDEQNLIGKEMFAIDGCKLPSNASKGWSGTRADFTRKAEKIENALKNIVHDHHANDHAGADEEVKTKADKYEKTLRKQLKKVKTWLSTNDDRIGKRGKPVKSNITDKDSAKMKTSKGVIQGYNGVTAVDSKKQIIVAAEAFGQGHEQDLLEPMVDEVSGNFTGRTDENKKCSFAEKMKRKIDSAAGRAIYSMRLAVGEPPFAHIRSILGLDRFTLRSKKKVDTQWKLFCIVHNLKKVHSYGAGFAWYT